MRRGVRAQGGSPSRGHTLEAEDVDPLALRAQVGRLADGAAADGRLRRHRDVVLEDGEAREAADEQQSGDEDPAEDGRDHVVHERVGLIINNYSLLIT